MIITAFETFEKERYQARDDLITAIRMFAMRLDGMAEEKLLDTSIDVAVYVTRRQHGQHLMPHRRALVREMVISALNEVELASFSPEVVRAVMRAAGVMSTASSAGPVGVIDVAGQVGTSTLPGARVDLPAQRARVSPQEIADFHLWPAAGLEAPAATLGRSAPGVPRAMRKTGQQSGASLKPPLTASLWASYFSKFEARADCPPPTPDEQLLIKNRFPTGAEYSCSRAFLMTLRAHPAAPGP